MTGNHAPPPGLPKGQGTSSGTGGQGKSLGAGVGSSKSICDDSSDEENAHANSPRKPGKTEPPAKRLKQSDVRGVFTIKVCELTQTDAAASAPAVEPPLDDATATGRFMRIPRDLWPNLGGPDCAGWVAKIVAVHKTTKLTTLQFHDSKQHFNFDTVKTWVPLL